MLSRCGIKFERRYILGERLTPTTAIVVGKGVDAATNRNLQNKIDTTELLPVEAVQDTARDSVNESVADEGLKLTPDEQVAGEAKSKGAAVDKAVRLARKHALSLAPTLKPAAVQVQWSLEIPGFPFDIVGTRDLDEVDGRIRDLKTSGKTPGKMTAHTSDQGTMYALAKWAIEKVELPVKFTLDTIVDLQAAPKVHTQHSKRGREDFEAVYNRIENAARVLEKGAFVPARQDDWYCSARWCGYYSDCRFARSMKQFSIGGPEE